MKNIFFNKLRELDRTYDFAEGLKKIVKKRSHKRSRQQIKQENERELKDSVD